MEIESFMEARSTKSLTPALLTFQMEIFMKSHSSGSLTPVTLVFWSF